MPRPRPRLRRPRPSLRIACSILLLLGFAAPLAWADGGGGSMRMPPRGRQGESAAVPLNQAQKAILRGQFEEAIDHLEDARKAEPRNADVHNLLGYSHRKLGHYDEAIRHYKRALRYDRKHRGALEYMGVAYLEKGDMDEARKTLERLEKVCKKGCKQLDMLRAAFAERPEPVAEGVPPDDDGRW